MVHIATSKSFTTLIMCLAFAELDGSDALLCNRDAFNYKVQNNCVLTYKKHMAAVNYQDACPWTNTKRHYYILDLCVERVANSTRCNKRALNDEIILDLHHTYFFHCPYQKDPEMTVLLFFTLPCIIITILLPFLCSYITPMKN